MLNVSHKRNVNLNYKEIATSPVRLAKELKHQTGKTINNAVCFQKCEKTPIKGNLAKSIYPLTQQFQRWQYGQEKI